MLFFALPGSVTCVVGVATGALFGLLANLSVGVGVPAWFVLGKVLVFLPLTLPKLQSDRAVTAAGAVGMIGAVALTLLGGVAVLTVVWAGVGLRMFVPKPVPVDFRFPRADGLSGATCGTGV